MTDTTTVEGVDRARLLAALRGNDVVFTDGENMCRQIAALFLILMANQGDTPEAEEVRDAINDRLAKLEHVPQ